MKKGWAWILVAAAALSGCFGDDGLEAKAGDGVRLLVTADMGTQVLLDENLTLRPGTTVMELLQGAAHVETAHDGGFVVAIDGKRSTYPETKTDWFYHVNGRLAPSGANHQPVHPGDVVVWDHRPWNHTRALPFLLTGLDTWPGAPEPAMPEALQERATDPNFHVTISGDELVILDPWRRPVLHVPPPWYVAHVDVPGHVSLFTAASDTDAHALSGHAFNGPPLGLGVVSTPHGTLPIPAPTV